MTAFDVNTTAEEVRLAHEEDAIIGFFLTWTFRSELLCPSISLARMVYRGSLSFVKPLIHLLEFSSHYQSLSQVKIVLQHDY